MFGLSIAHMILLGGLALIVIGPKQLPEVARTLGRFLNELKRVTSDVTKTIVEARESTDHDLRSQGPYAGAPTPPTPETPHATTNTATTSTPAAVNEEKKPEHE